MQSDQINSHQLQGKRRIRSDIYGLAYTIKCMTIDQEGLDHHIAEAAKLNQGNDYFLPTSD